MNTLAPKIKRIDYHDKTTIVETNLLSSHIATNKILKWNEIDFPQSWRLNEVIPPKPQTNLEVNQIIQSTEGDVEVIFNSRRSLRISRISLPSSSASSRNHEEDKDTSTNLPTNLPNFSEYQRVDISPNNIVHPVREDDISSKISYNFNS